MNSLVLVLLSFAGYYVAYQVYGKYISKKIFNLDDKNVVPSEQFSDGVDFVPTRKNIVFGHHFTTIAGVGPIVGPAIGVIWGWLPAFLWVFLGSIFMGAVHDFSTLVISARNKGKSIADITHSVIGRNAMVAFQLILQLLLLLVLSVFALIVSNLFMMYPETVIPVWIQIPISLWLGRQIKRRNKNYIFILIALVLIYVSIIIGVRIPVDLNFLFKSSTLPPEVIKNHITVIWCLLLFVYMFFASTIPVDKLLQPRDYINSQQLFLILFVLIAGIALAHPAIAAPAINHSSFLPGSDVPPMAPLLFIVIACGAISGFHSIASSGTTVKQIKKESDMLYVGYGSMIGEGMLAVIVLVCVTAGIGMGIERNGSILHGLDSYNHFYASWASRNAGMGAKLESFIEGAVNFMAVLKIPRIFAQSLIAVFIVSFANTTLDSATRMQRITLQEFLLSGNRKLKIFENRYLTTFILLSLASVLTFLKPGGKGALLMWPLFGSLNQLLAALGLLVVTVYLYLKKKNYFIAFLPMMGILTMTLWAMVNNLFQFLNDSEILLAVLSMIILLLTIWLLVSGIQKIFKELKRS